MIKTHAGELKKIVELQKNEPTRNEIGEQVDNWITVGTRRAKVAPLSGRSYLMAKQAQSIQTHQVNMRYWSELQIRRRLKIVGSNRYLYIHNVSDLDERHIESELDCSEGTPA